MYPSKQPEPTPSHLPFRVQIFSSTVLRSFRFFHLCFQLVPAPKIVTSVNPTPVSLFVLESMFRYHTLYNYDTKMFTQLSGLCTYGEYYSYFDKYHTVLLTFKQFYILKTGLSTIWLLGDHRSYQN